MIIGDSFETIKQLFGSLDPDVHINRNGDFMFTIVSPGLEQKSAMDDAQVMAGLFRGLWKDFNILNSLVVVTHCPAIDDVEHDDYTEIRDLVVGYYNPFECVGGFRGLDELNWGHFHWTTASGLREKDRHFITKRFVDNFRGYPLKVNQFHRYPTAIDRKFIPTVVQQSHIYKQCTETGKSSDIPLLAE